MNSRPEQPATPDSQARSTVVLGLGGVAALLASTCCVVPLLFAIVGISGAWIGQLRLLEPYSYPLTALAAGCLLLAGWRIWRPAGDAMECDLEACRQQNSAARRWFWALAVLTVLPIVVREGAHFFY